MLLAINQFAQAISGQCVRLYCDNATAVAYLRKEGGTRSDSLTKIAQEILLRCDDLSVSLLPVHLPGARNVRADALSRHGTTLPGEWVMDPTLLGQIFSQWGLPLLDMFATRPNKQLPVFVSPIPDDTAWRMDALSFSWSHLGLVYAYPPGPIIPLVLAKIAKAEGTQVILIVPNQPLRPWYPDLLPMVRKGPWDLNLHTHPLRQKVIGVQGYVYHLKPEVLNLAAWLLSTDC